jgi:pyrimidine-nucleoside phosphorylase
MTLPFLPVEIIKKTRDRVPLTTEEIQNFIAGYTNGDIPDYQVSAWLMAVIWRGLTSHETYALTKAMLHSGTTLDLKALPQKKVDKHSTGGVGDKTSLILGPIVAACGVVVPMMSGRGLGHTGGTLDKLESIPGFITQLDHIQFKEILRQYGVCFIGQTKDICPADKKMYALRDVTGTVESLELISASIMSKKLAEDLDGLVLDVKFGSGAFMKSLDSAKALAHSLQHIGKNDGKKVTALLTNMSQPLGAFVGNSLEIFECLEILSGKSLINKVGTDLYADTRELSLVLAAHMIFLGGKAADIDASRKLAQEALSSGKALRLFEEVCKAQGGNLSLLPKAQQTLEIKASTSGYIAEFHGETIGMLGIKLGAGRAKVTDMINPTAGFKIHFKVGDKVETEDTLWTIYGDSMNDINAIKAELLTTVVIEKKQPAVFELVKEILY